MNIHFIPAPGAGRREYAINMAVAALMRRERICVGDPKLAAEIVERFQSLVPPSLYGKS